MFQEVENDGKKEVVINNYPKDIIDQNCALNILIFFITKAQKQGIYTIQESSQIWEAIRVFLPEDIRRLQDAERKPTTKQVVEGLVQPQDYVKSSNVNVNEGNIAMDIVETNEIAETTIMETTETIVSSIDMTDDDGVNV